LCDSAVAVTGARFEDKTSERCRAGDGGTMLWTTLVESPRARRYCLHGSALTAEEALSAAPGQQARPKTARVLDAGSLWRASMAGSAASSRHRPARALSNSGVYRADLWDRPWASKAGGLSSAREGVPPTEPFPQRHRHAPTKEVPPMDSDPPEARDPQVSRRSNWATSRSGTDLPVAARNRASSTTPGHEAVHGPEKGEGKIN